MILNADHRYEAGWEKELDEPEDFVRAIEFAKYLERHPYFLVVIQVRLSIEKMLMF